MDVVGLWEARVPADNNEVSVRNHRYEHVVAILQGFGIDAEDMQVLMGERTTAA